MRNDLPGYVIWHDQTAYLPWRWAARSLPAGYERKHGSHHGGALTREQAIESAKAHKAAAASGQELHLK